MLVLTRKQGQSIVINEDIEISIVEIGIGSVKIGINAGKNVKILRKELICQVKDENRESMENIEELMKKIK